MVNYYEDFLFEGVVGAAVSSANKKLVDITFTAQQRLCHNVGETAKLTQTKKGSPRMLEKKY